MAEQQGVGSQERRRKISVPKVRTVLKQIGDEITKDELQKLIFLAADHIPKSKTQGMSSLSFFSILEERQLIDTKENDVEYIIELLAHLPRFDLMKKLKSTYSESSFAEKIVVKERIEELNNCVSDAVMMSKTNIVEITSKQHKGNDGGFLQDPGLVQSMLENYNDTLNALENVTSERDGLKKQVTELNLEIESIRDDQNNLIWERNTALGAKSEFVFRESEMRKELSDLKRTNNLLEKTCTKANNDVEERDKELADLKTSLHKTEIEKNDLLLKLQEMEVAKIAADEELAKCHRDEEDNGRIKCKRCGLVYVEANNPVDACRYHSGQYGCVGSIKKKFEWSCCKNTNKNAPGCCKKKHLTIDYPLTPADVLSRKFTM